MSEQPYDPNYPVMIDVDRKVPDFGAEAPGKKSKPKDKTMGASLYLTGGGELAQIPKSGYALIEFDRTKISLGKGGGLGGPSSEGEEASVELEIHTICLPEDAKGDLASEFAKFAKSKNVDTEGMGGGEEEEAPEPVEGEEGET